jgi:hypothetical protein
MVSSIAQKVHKAISKTYERNVHEADPPLKKQFEKA